MKKFVVILGLAAMAAFPLSGAAATLYSQVSIWPGSNCHRWSSSHPEPTISNSAIYNKTTKVMYVDCPIERNTFAGFLEDPFLSASSIAVVDRNPNKNVVCSLNYLPTAQLGGNTIYTFSAASSGASATQQILDTGSYRPDNDTGYFYISCRIPPVYNGAASGLVSYRVAQDINTPSH